ncbi:MAG: YdcF family protein [Bryobacter sp.]
MAILLLLAVWIFRVFSLAWEVRAQAEIDEARAADVIIVLGAAEWNGRPSPVLRSRLDHALALYRQGLAPRIVTTGGAGGDPVHTEAEVSRHYLAGKGVPAENIFLESNGASTAQSIAASAEILRRQNWTSCILVSDGYHLFRAKKIMESHGFRCLGSPRPARETSQAEAAWLYLRQAAGYSLYQLGIRI